jgi:hypothetical protein
VIATANPPAGGPASGCVNRFKPKKGGIDMCPAMRLLDQEFTQETCYELLPEWKGIDVRITQLSGGITNKLYRIQSEKGDCTVRIYGDKTDLFVYAPISSSICPKGALPSLISSMTPLF